MIIWKKSSTPDNHLQEAGDNNNLGDGPINGSTRGPRGPKNLIDEQKKNEKIQSQGKLGV